MLNVVTFLAKRLIFCYFNSGIGEYFLNLKNSFFENQLKTKSNNNFNIHNLNTDKNESGSSRRNRPCRY
ncbi:hypothetical protein SPHINGO8BC_150532 [Sphingobacterium multivorum]|uniref:Uncharacterized protein n=1 Tax=Sphingobacterium multivorum TaxID=28454 RepID=A0A654APF4_SPHMU|nr:hypothetical protein SPHINGO8BC_150532 [Sphingobacterium multivorum]